ncbi:PRC-barrel domain containing protein [uncultured Streptomyces sp.]|uniref:PRC-barrel domain containing protein n=1 Tax=uncultured Streptomyces sp. TaxID=174707 RepID=UPI0026177B8A|nr:PRC-barrel domain containing protein [uncultured Streptomyces sp.]
MTDIWCGPAAQHAFAGADPTEFTVEAEDGGIGTVDRRSLVPEFDHLVVDAGVWKFGRSIAIPMGLVESVDQERRVIRLRCTKDQVKDAPRFERDQDTNDPAYLIRLGAYYDSLAVA